MDDKLVITVSPANRPELEFEVLAKDWPDLDALADMARERWDAEYGGLLQLRVDIEEAGEKGVGRFGSAKNSEADMIAKAMREAEESP